MTTFWVFMALVVLRWGLLLTGAVLVIRPVFDCPACFRETLLLQTAWLRRLIPILEWRWCPHCGWQGPARRAPRPQIRVATGRIRSRSDAETEAA